MFVNKQAQKRLNGELAERLNAAVLKTVKVNSLLGFESLTLRQKRPYLNPSSDTVAFSITFIKYIFVKGCAGVIFNFTRPKLENTHYQTQPRDEFGDFVTK